MSAQRLQLLKGHILPENKTTAMAGSPGPLTTHVLNTAMGIPASNLALHLYRQDPSTNAWSLIKTGTTNEDGRCPGLITPQAFTSDVYKIHFETAKYWERIGETGFYPYVEDASNNQQEEAKQREQEMRNSILAQVLDQSARARLNNLALVKPEKAKAVENYLIQMARLGQLGGKLKTTTTVVASKSFQEDRIWLNGKEEDISHPRLQSCLREGELCLFYKPPSSSDEAVSKGAPNVFAFFYVVRRLARKRRNDGNPSLDSAVLSHKVHICSVNNFPTAAGLASSAAGFACLVYTLAQVFGVEGELSAIARQGSGSACRSMYGGFVQWLMGQKEDGKDSVAQQVEPESHWPELRILVLVASAEKKPVGSTSGMQTSVETSALLKHRAESVVPGRMAEMIEAIGRRDFATFAELTMKDSNQFHATCLDTYPPIFYLSSVSQQVINLVHRYNRHYGETRVSYTFDAGPNAVIFTLKQHVPEFLQVVQHFFPPETNGGQLDQDLALWTIPPSICLVLMVCPRGRCDTLLLLTKQHRSPLYD
ncbi:Diphosphomevalonate decarboxylase [Takifugu flavidus]|uniref:Diphosphomevalonate decarboxylase n=1 Tax=Takifugu flavidus TaxID=433684 RepID=A0A5C6NR35_9TELE|nr:Diphosphomevalonate decarboxylase [Takifugu flavidus]